MKFLALDFGEKRVGVAVSDEEGIIARPLTVVQVTENLMGELGNIVKEEKPSKIVVGLPRHMSGELGSHAENVKKFAEGLVHEFNLKVDFQDESLTSVEAEKRLREMGFDSKKIKEMVDAEAAALILEDYLEERKQK